MIHHKQGNTKYYDLIGICIPDYILKEPDPFPCDFEHRKWRVLQRIGSIGLLWNRASDAWLGISGMKAKERDDIFFAFGEQFIGRIEMVYDRKCRKLNVINIWYESGVKMTKATEKRLNCAIRCFEKFNMT